jgi:uncharacterized protein
MVGKLRQPARRSSKALMRKDRFPMDRPEAPGAPLGPDEVMFSPAVRAEQQRDGSREAYARRAAAGGFAKELSPEAIAFIQKSKSAFFGTASSAGQPYVQHRGGPAGFIRVLDNRTLAFADYAGNRQHITAGHLAENSRAFLFLMDYLNARRLKLWGSADVVLDPALTSHLHDAEYEVERAVRFSVLALDWNCSRHIPRLVSADA